MTSICAENDQIRLEGLVKPRARLSFRTSLKRNNPALFLDSMTFQVVYNSFAGRLNVMFADCNDVGLAPRQIFV